MAEETEDTGVELPTLLTVGALGLKAGTVATPLLELSQYVEATRDGQPWCDEAVAEDLLVNSAKARMVGMAAAAYTTYELDFDSGTSILTLKLG